VFTRLHSGSHKTVSHPPVLFLSVHFNIFPSIPMSFRWSFSFVFSDRDFMHLISAMHDTFRLCLISLYLINFTIMFVEVRKYKTNLTDSPNLCLLPVFFCGVGLKPPLGTFFRSPSFKFLRSLCASPLGPYKSQHCGHIGLLCIPRMIHEGDCGVIGGANDDCR
jgi:hypothetical protein